MAYSIHRHSCACIGLPMLNVSLDMMMVYACTDEVGYSVKFQPSRKHLRIAISVLVLFAVSVMEG